MLDFLSLPATIKFFGMTGSFVAVICSIIVIFPYRGKLGEKYSILNHFISELGELGVSPLAWLFNLGLILGGLLLLPCAIGLGILIPGVWSKLGMIFGIIASISVALVGVFPMNNLDPHTKVAMTFFRTGLVMVVCFTIAVAFPSQQPPAISRLVSLVGMPAIFAYAFFLVYAQIGMSPVQADGTLAPILEGRPRVWVLAISEWSIFLTTILWFFAIALGL